ncbi:Hypothetical predicted protein [Prunus dulcis]|uniref:Uncharacterized protein n=1 Tax=Prunus dulcis TaxID=3755 RepID=A0A5E4ESN6_PRUDU|nr:hypothetical protein L3X38_002453 [Prunus dulcis]VVA16828.1 Hypothetical predicted protein [Prunus dulcis]
MVGRPTSLTLSFSRWISTMEVTCSTITWRSLSQSPEHLKSFRSTNQSSREASELRLKRQVVSKCDRSMLLATTTTCRKIAEDSSSASIGQIATVDLGLERWLSW